MNIKQFVIRNDPKPYIIESFSPQTRAEILTLPTQLRRHSRGLKLAIFQGQKRGFLPQTSCFSYEHFCPFAGKVLTPAGDFPYN